MSLNKTLHSKFRFTGKVLDILEFDNQIYLLTLVKAVDGKTNEVRVFTNNEKYCRGVLVDIAAYSLSMSKNDKTLNVMMHDGEVVELETMINEDNSMANSKEEIIYKTDLGINFNGYPLDGVGVDEVSAITKVFEDSQYLRLHKNLDYELVVVVRAKKKAHSHIQEALDPTGDK